MLLFAGVLGTAGCIQGNRSAPDTPNRSVQAQTTVPALTWNTSDWIRIDRQPDRRVYESFSITGNTSAPEGSALHVEAYSRAFCPNMPRIINQTVLVEKGEHGINRWSVPAEPGIFTMNDYLITVYPENKKDLAVSQFFNMLSPQGRWIHITRVNDFKDGGTLAISGFTDEDAGDIVGISMEQSGFYTLPRNCGNYRTNLTGSAAVVATDRGYSTGSFNESLDNFCPDEYILIATSGNVSDSIVFLIRSI